MLVNGCGSTPLSTPSTIELFEVTPDTDMVSANAKTITSRYFTSERGRRGRQLVGVLLFPGVVIDIRDQIAANPEYVLNEDDVLAWEAEYGRIPGGSFVLLYTGGEERPKSVDPDYFLCCDNDIKTFLLEGRQAAGIGSDSKEVFFRARGLFVAEGLSNFDQIPPVGFTLRIEYLYRRDTRERILVSARAMLP
jgi:hypothetical protein